MMMRLLGVSCQLARAAAFVLSCALAGSGGAWGANKPNIVYILADDLGWKDVGFHGGTIRTPNLDRLAAGGAVLNAFYCQPFSTQTRAALMTGRYPMRYGLQTATIMPSSQFGLPADERTLAQALKEAGYDTAFIGKWQLGHAKQEFWPTRRGFDYFYGSLSGRVDYVLKQPAKADWRRNEQPVKDEGYVTALLGRDAANLIGKHDPARPLLLVLSFAAPAAPYGAAKELVEKYRDVSEPARRSYAAAVSALDDAVGQVVSALEQRRMLDDTLIVFHSDNGGALPTKFPTGDADVDDFAADNGVFRDGRGSLYEGGVRTVALASWPGRIKPKSVVTDMLHVTDMYATLLKLSGASLEQPKKLDGMDLWATLAEAAPSPRKEILINVEDFRGAIRIGEWKLVLYAALPSRFELYDISNDPGEADNVADRYPERVKQMLARLDDYAYEMAPSKYLEELVATKAGQTPIFWRLNPVRR
jgi:arylsulfatase A-like enzyme